MNEHCKRMRGVLMAACEATGIVESQEDLAFDEAANIFSLGGTRVEVEMGPSKSWLVVHSFDVTDLRSGGVKTIRDVVGAFKFGEEAMAAKAAVMKVLEYMVDSAIDGVS